MASVRAEDGTFISYPFIDDGDTSTKVYNMVCSQLASDYEANQVELDTPMTSAASAGVIELPFPADNAAFFVGDTGHASKTGGMLSFTRTFANVPKSTTIASGSEVMSFPGIGAGGLGIESLSNSITVGQEGLIIETKISHGMKAGDSIAVSQLYARGTKPGETTIYIDSFQSSLTTTLEILEVISSTELRVDYGTGYSHVYTWDLQGGTASRVAFPVYDLSSISMTSGVKGVTITTTGAHDFGPGVEVNLNMSYRVGSEPAISTISGRFTVIDTPTLSSFTVDAGRYWSGQVNLNLISGVVKVLKLERDALSENIATETRYDYILPGVTPGILTSEDVNVPSPFGVITAEGLETDTVEDFSWEFTGGVYRITIPTHPSREDYINMLQNEHRIIMEASLAKWAGNILVMKTKTCKAR